MFTCLFVDRCYEYSKIQFVSACTRGEVISSMSPWEGKYITKLRNCASYNKKRVSIVVTNTSLFAVLTGDHETLAG